MGHHPESVAAERAKAGPAQVRGQDVEMRFFRELKQAPIAEQESFIVELKKSRPCHAAIRITQKSARPAQEERQRKPAHDPVADVEANEVEHLGRGGVELAG